MMSKQIPRKNKPIKNAKTDTASSAADAGDSSHASHCSCAKRAGSLL
jgi:hypothetical protein